MTHLCKSMPCDVAASKAKWQNNHCDAKRPTSVTDTPTDDQPGFVAETPEHCHACYRLIQPGQTY